MTRSSLLVKCAPSKPKPIASGGADSLLSSQRSRASGSTKRRISQAQAEVYALQGSLPAAIEQLEIARRSGGGDFYQLSVVDARLKELRAQHAQDVRESKR